MLSHVLDIRHRCLCVHMRCMNHTILLIWITIGYNIRLLRFTVVDDEVHSLLQARYQIQKAMKYLDRDVDIMI